MDSLTHIAIGACIGDLFLEKKIGKRAMVYGALAASLPDIDFVASFWLNTPDDLLAHRGFTHSFLFAVLAVIGLAFYFRKRHRVENVAVKTWLIFLGTEIFIHLFLDAFNAYGVGWFEPFNQARISFNTIFVADPFFSVWPGIAAFVLLLLKRNNRKRRTWAKFGLVCCSLYFMYCIYNKLRIDDQIRYALIHQGIHYSRYFSTPTAFNNWLWYDVAESDSGFYIGYRSVFDKAERIDFRYILKRNALLRPFIGKHDLQALIRFSQGYYTVDSSAQGIIFNDLRFGQILGWKNSHAYFAFHYYLQDSGANKMVVQRGRFSGWDWENVKGLIRRIKGH